MTAIDEARMLRRIEMERETTSAGIAHLKAQLDEARAEKREAGTLRAFDLEGSDKTVSLPGGTTDLSSSLPHETFEVMIVADYRAGRLLPTSLSP